MYARIGRFEIVEGKQQQLVDGYKAALEILRTQKGYQEAILMVDSQTGQAVSVTLWDEKDSLDTPEAAAVLGRMLPMVSPFQKGKPTFSLCEVKVRDK
jgi:quinol monooxygenase YgiN